MSSTDLNYFVFLAANFMINCLGRKESLPGLELIKPFPIQIIWPIKKKIISKKDQNSKKFDELFKL